MITPKYLRQPLLNGLARIIKTMKERVSLYFTKV